MGQLLRLHCHRVSLQGVPQAILSRFEVGQKNLYFFKIGDNDCRPGSGAPVHQVLHDLVVMSMMEISVFHLYEGCMLFYYYLLRDIRF